MNKSQENAAKRKADKMNKSQATATAKKIKIKKVEYSKKSKRNSSSSVTNKEEKIPTNLYNRPASIRERKSTKRDCEIYSDEEDECDSVTLEDDIEEFSSDEEN